MKHTFFKLFLTVLLLTRYSVCTNADTFTKDGIRYNITASNTVGVIGYSNISGNVAIPSSVYYNGRTYPVVYIDSYAFNGCDGLTSITIPNSVTSIEFWAFGGCTSLASISVNQGNTKYNSRDNCNAIIETESNTLILGCKNTVIPNSVTSIGKYAFRNCKGLTSITIPNSVTSVGDWAFEGYFRVLQKPDINYHPQLRDEHRKVCFQELQGTDINHHPQLSDERRRLGFRGLHRPKNSLLSASDSSDKP